MKDKNELHAVLVMENEKNCNDDGNIVLDYDGYLSDYNKLDEVSITSNLEI